MALEINTALRNRQADSWGSDLNSGFIDIYTGAQPGDPNTAPTGTLLVSCALDADAYADAVAGVAVKNGVVSGIAGNTGTAGYAVQRNAANTRWGYGSVTTVGGGGNVELNTLTINAAQTVTINTSIITQPEG